MFNPRLMKTLDFTIGFLVGVYLIDIQTKSKMNKILNKSVSVCSSFISDVLSEVKENSVIPKSDNQDENIYNKEESKHNENKITVD